MRIFPNSRNRIWDETETTLIIGEMQKKLYKLGEEMKVTIWRQTVWLMEKGKSSTIYSP